MGNVLASFSGFDDFLAYLAVSLALVVCFLAVYVRVTPHREFQLIREGNLAAAFSLSGALLGFIVPLASAIEYSVGLVEIAANRASAAELLGLKVGDPVSLSGSPGSRSH